MINFTSERGTNLKTIKIILVSLFVLIPLNTTFAASPKTFDHYIPMDEGIEEHWAYGEIDNLINADIIDGFMDDENNMYVKPDNNITRAEFVKLIVTSLGLDSNGTGKTFTDVKKGAWYYEFVKIASSLGIINGKSAEKFAPDEKINRAEMTKIIVEAFENTIEFPQSSQAAFTDINNSWAKDYIKTAAGAELVNGTGKDKFSPLGNAKRAEAIVIIHRAMQKEQTNVAEDEEITTFLNNHILKDNELTEANNFEELEKLYAQNSIGFYMVQGTEFGGVDFLLEEMDGEFSVTIDDDNLALEVLSKSNRFANVEATGIKVSVVFKSTEMNMDYTIDLDGFYQLKKDNKTGSWKIYNYYPYFDEEEPL